jgi:hypothetical protein
VNQSLALVQNAHRSVIVTVGTLAECSIAVRDSIEPLPNNRIGAEAMRAMMVDYAGAMNAMYEELLNSIGKKIFADLIESIGKVRP